MPDPHIDDEDYLDLSFDTGVCFLVPSRAAWKEVKHKFVNSDYIVVQSNDGPLERFTFRKV